MQVRTMMLGNEDRFTPPMRVCSIGDSWVCTMIDPEQGDPFEDNIEDVRPIPLTVDLFAKNGWMITKNLTRFRLEIEDVKGKTYAAVDAEIRDEGRLYLDVMMKEFRLTTYINYVHDLQHYLRLAGIEKEIEL